MIGSPERRRRYNVLPRGQAWVDSRVRTLVDAGEAKPLTRAEVPPAPTHYDWLSVSVCHSDHAVAQRWYVALVAVAPIFGYTKPIRVLLHDDEPRWVEAGGIMMIPRGWEPSTPNAFALFAVHLSPRAVSPSNTN